MLPVPDEHRRRPHARRRQDRCANGDTRWANAAAERKIPQAPATAGAVTSLRAEETTFAPAGVQSSPPEDDKPAGKSCPLPRPSPSHLRTDTRADAWPRPRSDNSTGADGPSWPNRQCGWGEAHFREGPARSTNSVIDTPDPTARRNCSWRVRRSCTKTAAPCAPPFDAVRQLGPLNRSYRVQVWQYEEERSWQRFQGVKRENSQDAIAEHVPCLLAESGNEQANPSSQGLGTTCPARSLQTLAVAVPAN